MRSRTWTLAAVLVLAWFGAEPVLGCWAQLHSELDRPSAAQRAFERLPLADDARFAELLPVVLASLAAEARRRGSDHLMIRLGRPVDLRAASVGIEGVRLLPALSDPRAGIDTPLRTEQAAAELGLSPTELSDILADGGLGTAIVDEVRRRPEGGWRVSVSVMHDLLDAWGGWLDVERVDGVLQVVAREVDRVS